MKKHLLIFFFYIFFFILIYNEQMMIGPVKLSHLWKMFLLAILFIFVLRHRIIYRFSSVFFNKYAYLYGIVKLFNAGVFVTPMVCIADFACFITFPIFLDFFLIRNLRAIKIEKLLMHVSQFVILSFIPFLFGFLESKKKLNIQFQEIYKDAGRTSGIFETSHGASAILAFSLIIIIFQLFSSRLSIGRRFFYLFLCFVGIYAIISTYARGGWLMLLVGTIFLFIRNNVKTVLIGIIISVVVFFSLESLIEKNEYFYNRITDKNEQGIQSKQVGSGRLVYAYNGVKFWLESETPQQFLTGRGLEELRAYQKEKTGMYIYCHNGFIDSLAQNGAIGLIFFISFQVGMLMYVIRSKNVRKRLYICIVLMEIVFQFVQGGTSPYQDIFLALIIYLSSKKKNLSLYRLSYLHLYFNKTNGIITFSKRKDIRCQYPFTSK